MKKILFVCLGNICRSAIAEGVLKRKVDALDLQIEVDSAGTSAHHIGENPDRRMQKKGMEYGVDISNQTARQFDVSDFEKFDYIFPMDTSNYNAVINLAPNRSSESKVSLFLDLSHPNENRSVPDPYYGGEEGFEEVFQLIDRGCDLLLKKLHHA